jgi:hypothetical protein
MIQGAFFSLFNFVSNNKVAQIILLCGVGYLIMRWKEEADEARGARRANERAEKATRKAADKTLKQIQERNDDRIEDAQSARDSVPDDVTADSMSDDAYEFLFGRKRDSG